MRNMFTVSLLVFVAVCAGAYTILWYGQALSAKHAIEQLIEKANEKQKYLTYDAIETGGFPSDINVSIIKPHFKGRVDELLKNVSFGGQLPYSGMQEWAEDSTLDGKVTIGINALSNHYTVHVSGDWIGSATINGQTYTSTNQQMKDFGCELQLKRENGIFDTLWDLKSFNRDGKTMIKDFRLLDCNGSGGKTIDSASKNILTSSGPMQLYIVNSPQQDTARIHFYLKLTDAEITPLGNTQMLTYIRTVSPDYDFPVSLSAYGKQNFIIDSYYSGPVDLQAAGKNPAIDIAVNQMDITNQMYSDHLVFHFNNIATGGNRTTKLSLRNETTVSQQYDLLLQNLVRNAIRSIYVSNTPSLKEIQAIVKKFSTNELYNIIQPAIPNFYPLGKIVVALNSDFKGSEDFKNGEMSFDTFEISADPYGIVGKGSNKIESNMPSTMNGELKCTNCLQMIDDITTYASKLQKAIATLDPEKSAGMIVNLQKVDAIKKFLEALSDVPKDTTDKSNTFTYVISSSGQNTTINNKSAADVIKLYNEYMQPTLKKPDDVGASSTVH